MLVIKSNNNFWVTIARGSHPFPSRTRKLSLSAPIVLHAQVCGRPGRIPPDAKKRPGFLGRAFFDLSGRLPGLPHTCACSTIGAERLNCRVRDGNGWDPLAMVTQKLRCSQISGSRRETFGASTLNIDGPLKPLILFFKSRAYQP